MNQSELHGGRRRSVGKGPARQIVAPRDRPSDGSTPRYAIAPRSIVPIFWATLCAAVAVGLAFSLGGGPQQSFAANGLAKRALVPAMLIALTMVLIVSWRRLVVPMPVWWWLLGGALVFSLIRVVLSDGSPQSVLNLAQSAALLVGALVLFAIGCGIREWPGDRFQLLLLVAVVASISSLVLRTHTLVPFVGIVLPTVAVLLWTGIRERRPAMSVLGGGLAIWVGSLIAASTREASIALLAQIAAAGGILVLALAPKAWRVFLAVVLGGLLAWRLIRDRYVGVFFGDFAHEDVTLAQRGYETRRVWEDLASAGILDMLVGKGPAATVDLSASPDVLTLIAAGRDVSRVDDTHLLTTWLLLKFGLIGVIILVLIAASIGRAVWRVLSARRPDVIDLGLSIYVVCGFAFAIPAATNFFVEPATFLCLGALYARQLTAFPPVNSPGARSSSRRT